MTMFVRCISRYLRKSDSLFHHRIFPIRQKTSYEGDGRSTANIMNNEVDFGLMIDSVSTVGFRLNNGTAVIGPLVLFHRSVLSWNVRSIEEINEESLSLFKVLEPKVDFLVLGLGDTYDTNNSFHKVFQVCKKANINVEILPTEAACSTFNFLNMEGRNVVALLLPPRSLKITDDDVVSANIIGGVDRKGMTGESTFTTSAKEVF